MPGSSVRWAIVVAPVGGATQYSPRAPRLVFRGRRFVAAVATIGSGLIASGRMPTLLRPPAVLCLVLATLAGCGSGGDARRSLALDDCRLPRLATAARCSRAAVRSIR